MAVGRFVTVGEAIAIENQELKEEMSFACYEARRAGKENSAVSFRCDGDTIAHLTDMVTLEPPESDGRATIFSDKAGMVKAARMLLSSVTKVLVLADRIVIKQIITSRNKVWNVSPDDQTVNFITANRLTMQPPKSYSVGGQHSSRAAYRQARRRLARLQGSLVRGDTIAHLTDMVTLEPSESDGRATIFSDKAGMVKAARMLLSSVTKVLVLADRIVIKQIITSRNKVLRTLEQLEKVSSFQEFVQIFSQFGNEMVEFAHLTGDRQNDLKDEKKKSRMAAARAVLEKCTMMLLTASKTCLRHPDCDSARINKDGVFQRMRLALEQVIVIVTEARPNGEGDILPVSIYMGIREFKVRGSIPAPQQDMGIRECKVRGSIPAPQQHMGMRECKKQLEGLREGLCLLSKENLTALLEVVLEHTEDFTDLAYTSHEHRERILELSRQARLELLHNAAAELAADLLKYHADHIVLKALKVSGGEGSLEALAEYTCKLSEQKEQLVETCRLLRHISGTEPLEITCIHAEDTFQVTGPQIISAAHTLALHPSSKIAKENLDVFCEAWESQLNDMSILLREIIDLFEGIALLPSNTFCPPSQQHLLPSFPATPFALLPSNTFCPPSQQHHMLNRGFEM
ncbi:UNVERIFIED_CONTAM: hypothetical protein FKN15_055553 [Acipenser sinensis]